MAKSSDNKILQDEKKEKNFDDSGYYERQEAYLRERASQGDKGAIALLIKEYGEDFDGMRPSHGSAPRYE